MAKFVRIHKHYFQDSNDTSKIYMVCLAMNKNNNYLWEIYSRIDGTWHEQAHSGYWKKSWDEALDEGIEVFLNNHENAIEINYTECYLAMFGNFEDSKKLKEEILELIQEHKPEILAYFM